MKFFTKKSDLLLPYKLLLLFLQNQKNKNRKNYDINEKNVLTSTKSDIKNSDLLVVLEIHFTTLKLIFMSVCIKNRLAKRRVCGVERLVGCDRRGNLNFREVVPRYFYVQKTNGVADSRKSGGAFNFF
jgi:hypothetical protein